jgi:hemoglobin/transferrin/lactoferrin receptor protein
MDGKNLVRNHVKLLLLLGFTGFSGVNQPLMADDTKPIVLDPIVVVASKTPRPMSEVAGQVSVIDANQIKQHLLEGLDDLFRYEPGLNSETSGTRFGVSGVNIRGIGGNRVAIEIDGVPVRKGFATGSYSNGGQALIETDLVERLEVLHGPASSLYGSDALGGVMAFTTWDPDDLLAQGNGEHWYSLRAGNKGSDQSNVVSVAGAWAGNTHGLFISAIRRDGHESDHNNPSEVAADPQDWSSEDYFLRYTFDTANANRLRLTIEDFGRDSDTSIHSILGFSRFRSTTALRGIDRDESQKILLDYEFSTEFWDRAVVRAFRTQTETVQLTLEERATARVPSRYERLFSYNSRLEGAELNLFRHFALGGSDHHLGVGFEYLGTRTNELRDGYQQLLADGSITKTILGEVMPVRDFPNAMVNEWGMFVQDEISFDNGWSVIPSLRWDQYDLDPRPDTLYLEDYSGTEIVQIEEHEVSPRLGVIRDLNDEWSIYGQYVNGFRAPPHEDANIGLDISVFRFRAIPNPELKSETSRGYEFGIRQFSASRHFSMAVFETDYDNFIDSRAPIGTDPESGYLLFQSRNISQAKIRGLDIRFNQDLDVLSHKWSGWSLNSALYWSEGENLDNGQALNSVSPPQAVFGLSWFSPDEQWNAHLTGTFTRRQDEIDQTEGARFETPGYSVFDLSATYRHESWLELSAGIRNLAGRHYWRWSDVSRLAPNDPMLQLLSQSGRSYNFSARFQW